jgi:addiction module HigA family antidote
MNRDKESIYKPETVSHPGLTVLDYLDFFGWSQRDLARRTGITPKTISEICSGKTSISPNTAILFEKVFKRPAHFWLNLQQLYDEADARSKIEACIDDWKEWAKKFPVGEMKRFGWFDEDVKTADVNSLLDFFGVSSPKSWNSVWEAANVAYRQTRKFKTTPEAISAWVRATELMAAQLESEVTLKEFNDDYLRSCINQFRSFTRLRVDKAIPKIQSLSANAGLLVVWVPELKHTGISGCARWLTDNKPLIALTLRYKTDDQMWFTFFHELGHILLHRKEKMFILDNAAEDMGDHVVDPPMQEREEEANRFAADTLIPPDLLMNFISKNKFDSDSVIKFSENIGIGPGILVGRLQREGVIARHQGNMFKQKLDWSSKE